MRRTINPSKVNNVELLFNTSNKVTIKIKSCFLCSRNINAVNKEELLSSVDNTKSSKSSVSDTKHPHSVPISSRELTPEDFGFGNLNVSPQRVTRSQTIHFPTKIFESHPPSDIFKRKYVNLSPPKLQVDKSFDYQMPPTRSSSQSSGFFSLSHQKYLDESRSPSVIGDDLDSISQSGRNALIPYPHSPFSSLLNAIQYPPSFAVVHLTHNGFNKFYQFPSVTSYEPTLNVSTMSTQSCPEQGWFQTFKNTSSSLVFLFLITSNVAILWKVFGEEYFNMKT